MNVRCLALHLSRPWSNCDTEHGTYVALALLHKRLMRQSL